MAENTDKRFKDSIIKLQDVIQELKTVGQQLTANEQQLRAANQQLVANEQQLRAEITERKKAEEEIKESEEKFRLLVSEVKDYAILRLNPDGTIASWNEGAQLIKGYKAEEIIGEHFSRFYTEEDVKAGKLALGLKVTEKEGRFEDVGWRVRKDGTRFIANVVITALRDDRGKLKGFSKVTRDITERIRAEEKVKASEQQLRASNQQLTANEQQLRAANQQLTANEQQLRAANQKLSANEQQLRAANQQLAAGQKELKRFLKALSAKNKELQSVVYVASHDLRTPLVNIQGFAGELAKSCGKLSELLKGKGADKALNRKIAPLLDEDIPESLRFINASAGMMSRLLDGLLRISRIGSAEIKIETIEMNKLMKNVQRSLEFQIQQSGATVTIKKLPGCYGDISLLNQVFSNLLDNAIKYLDNKRKGKITISGRVEDNNSIYCVEDNGIGIDRKHQEKVFEIFHRLSPEGQVAGEGLGLSAVWRLLSRLDGTILVESEPGKGSRFLVTLPNSK